MKFSFYRIHVVFEFQFLIFYVYSERWIVIGRIAAEYSLKQEVGIMRDGELGLLFQQQWEDSVYGES